MHLSLSNNEERNVYKFFVVAFVVLLAKKLTRI